MLSTIYCLRSTVYCLQLNYSGRSLWYKYESQTLLIFSSRETLLLSTIYCLRSTVSCLLPNVNSLTPARKCEDRCGINVKAKRSLFFRPEQPFSVYYLLPTVYCLLSTVYCLQLNHSGRKCNERLGANMKTLPKLESGIHETVCIHEKQIVNQHVGKGTQMGL